MWSVRIILCILYTCKWSVCVCVCVCVDNINTHNHWRKEGDNLRWQEWGEGGDKDNFFSSKDLCSQPVNPYGGLLHVCNWCRKPKKTKRVHKHAATPTLPVGIVNTPSIHTFIVIVTLVIIALDEIGIVEEWLDLLLELFNILLQSFGVLITLQGTHSTARRSAPTHTQRLIQVSLTKG